MASCRVAAAGRREIKRQTDVVRAFHDDWIAFLQHYLHLDGHYRDALTTDTPPSPASSRADRLHHPRGT